MGENQFDWPNRPAAQPSAHCLLKARHFPLQRRVYQFILGCEAIDEATLTDAGTLCDGVERETLAPGFEDYSLSGIENSISIDLFFSRQNNPLLFRPTSRISFPT